MPTDPGKHDAEDRQHLTSRDEDLIEERLRMTPRQRLDALLDGLAWEERARKARRIR